MDVFRLNIDPIKFQKTNATWNRLKLNAPWSVGYVSQLIEARPFNRKEQWEHYYYQSGQVRDRALATFPLSKEHQLNNELLLRYDDQAIGRFTEEQMTLNYYFGRTKEQLNKKGLILYQEICKKYKDFTIKECEDAVRFRVIGETWNGIILREHNTVRGLQSIFPNLTFIKKDGAFDHHYAVDYEVLSDDQLICAIQIKPRSYLSKAEYVLKAKNSNFHKNQQYMKEFKVRCIDIIANQKGEVVNKSSLKELSALTSYH